MKIESEVCEACPIRQTCDPNLVPQHSKGKRLLTSNPWNCRHLTCQAGVGEAKKQINKLKDQNIFSGYAYFNSLDKPSKRRVKMETGIIESNQNGKWYTTGESIHGTYVVDSKFFPFRWIRDIKE